MIIFGFLHQQNEANIKNIEVYEIFIIFKRVFFDLCQKMTN